MTDIEKLVAALREEADAVSAIEWDIPICTSNHIREAADTINRLVEQNKELGEAYKIIAKLKAERDALKGEGK